MAYRVTGASGFGFGAQWEKVSGDADVARRVVAFLEDRRLLFGPRHLEDEVECVFSAGDIRRFLTQEIGQLSPGTSLCKSLRAMRAACRKFLDAAGPNARNFRGVPAWEAGPFGLALGDLRTLVGVHVALIADQYDIEVEPELAAIMPPIDEDDASWLPGFDDGEPRRPADS